MMKKVGAGGCRPLFFRNSSCYRFKAEFWPADRRIDSWKYRRQIRDIQEGEKMDKLSKAIKKVDGVGRVVLPIEARKIFSIHENDSLEIFGDKDNRQIILQKIEM